jgi:AcrR family transcriptional regulator
MMDTTTRKQREIQQREAEVLEVARKMLLRGGYHEVNMDRIARELGCSKGTVYNHFSCKEEILLALTLETMDKRTAMFQRAAGFVGQSRERMTAIGVAQELFVRRYPGHFKVEQIVRAASIWEKTSQERRERLIASETRCMTITAGVVRDAIAQRDLVLPAGMQPEEVVFGFWSMGFGAFALALTSSSLSQLGVGDPIEALWDSYTALVDGYGWQPLSSDFDMMAVRRRVEQEVFGAEMHVATLAR